MRRNPKFVENDPEEIRELVRSSPWATIVSHTEKGLVASHYPFLLDEEHSTDDEIVLFTHVGCPDEHYHELGQHEVLVIVQGPHGYISPGWYGTGEYIPTWNHVSAHLWGTPEILSDDENLRVLGALVDRFESEVDEPASLDIDPEGARQAATGTVGIRIRVDRFQALRKLSQNNTPESVSSIVEHLEGDGPYQNAPLAAEMRREHGL